MVVLGVLPSLLVKEPPDPPSLQIAEIVPLLTEPSKATEVLP